MVDNSGNGINPKILEQTDAFNDSTGPKPDSDELTLDDIILDSDTNDNPKEKRVPKNPLGDIQMPQLNIRLIAGAVLLVVVIAAAFAIYNFFGRDQGADFMQDAESGEEIVAFSYTPDERDLLRENGYTADDIEKNEAWETDPYKLVEDAKAARQAVLDAEVKPIYDGASQAYKDLEASTWVGLPKMSNAVFDDTVTYTKKYGTFNCDYTKVAAKGIQLFLKLDVKELKSSVFMTVSPDVYKKLADTGNIVVNIDYWEYSTGDYVITYVEQKDIIK